MWLYRARDQYWKAVAPPGNKFNRALSLVTLIQ